VNVFFKEQTLQRLKNHDMGMACVHARNRTSFHICWAALFLYSRHNARGFPHPSHLPHAAPCSHRDLFSGFRRPPQGIAGNMFFVFLFDSLQRSSLQRPTVLQVFNGFLAVVNSLHRSSTCLQRSAVLSSLDNRQSSSVSDSQ
jgi:hypothetical protein